MSGYSDITMLTLYVNIFKTIKQSFLLEILILSSGNCNYFGWWAAGDMFYGRLCGRRGGGFRETHPGRTGATLPGASIPFRGYHTHPGSHSYSMHTGLLHVISSSIQNSTPPSRLKTPHWRFKESMMAFTIDSPMPLPPYSLVLALSTL